LISLKKPIGQNRLISRQFYRGNDSIPRTVRYALGFAFVFGLSLLAFVAFGGYHMH